jgi:uncharacterized protein YabN with tetrapyrrole methylase and pyrophosphatase domain
VSEHGKKFNDFIQVVRLLRSEKGCPWDRKQTPESLLRYLSEETEEVVEAIKSDNSQNIKDELGDILYILILLSQIYEEKKVFDISDVIDSISAKMTRRHPNVFGEEETGTIEQQRQRWLEIKSQEISTKQNAKKN